MHRHNFTHSIKQSFISNSHLFQDFLSQGSLIYKQRNLPNLLAAVLGGGKVDAGRLPEALVLWVPLPPSTAPCYYYQD